MSERSVGESSVKQVGLNNTYSTSQDHLSTCQYKYLHVGPGSALAIFNGVIVSGRWERCDLRCAPRRSSRRISIASIASLVGFLIGMGADRLETHSSCSQNTLEPMAPFPISEPCIRRTDDHTTQASHLRYCPTTHEQGRIDSLALPDWTHRHAGTRYPALRGAPVTPVSRWEMNQQSSARLVCKNPASHHTTNAS